MLYITTCYQHIIRRSIMFDKSFQVTEDFKKILNEEMRNALLTKAQLAAKLGLSPSTIFAWFNGQSKGIRPSQWNKLVSVFPRLRMFADGDVAEDYTQERSELLSISVIAIKQNLITFVCASDLFDEPQKLAIAKIIKESSPKFSMTNTEDGIKEIYGYILFELILNGMKDKKTIHFIESQYQQEIEGYRGLCETIKRIKEI